VDSASPSFMKRFEPLRADAVQVAVASCAIVEAIDVVVYVAQREPSVLVNLLLDPFLLQAAEEGLRDSIEAPMCQECCLGGHRHGIASPMIGQEPVVDLARNEALQAADDVSFTETLSRSARHVVHRGLMPPHAHGHDPVESRVGLAMAAAKESVAMRHTARRWNRARAS